jgi:hypothetical protein
MRLVGLAALALLTACNLAFGLEPTVPLDATFVDFDGDGITDDTDNCPTVSNSEQTNTDGDPFGDACDTCLTFASLTTHDEDQDTIGDSCDLCPGVEAFNDDSDHDEVGDICDPAKDTAGNARLFFETFETVSDWHASGASWRMLGDEVAPEIELPPTDGGFANTTFTATAPWTAIAGFASTKPWTPQDVAGVEATFGAHTLRCQVSCAPMTVYCKIDVLVDGVAGLGTAPVYPSPFSRIRLQAFANNAIGCYWDQPGLSTVFNTFSVTGPATFAVVSSPSVHVTYFEVVR